MLPPSLSFFHLIRKNHNGGENLTERAIWSGSVQVGLMALPVRLHTAIREHSAGFNMISPYHLNEKGEPCINSFVGYDTKCKTCGKPVKRTETKKGFKFGDQVVVIEPTELGQLMPKTTKTIEIVGFAKSIEMDFMYSSTPYYTTPNTDPKKGGTQSALKVYNLLREVLELTSTVAFGRYVRGGKEHLLALRPYKGVLVLQQVYWFDEVRDVPEVEACELTADERVLAKELINQLSKKLDLSEFEDTFQQKVGELITAKAMGREISIEQEAAKPTIDLIDALKASVKATKVAVEATA